MELQLLVNVPKYCSNAFISPAIIFDSEKKTEWPWIAVVFLFGKWSIGLRIYRKAKGEA